MEIVPVFLVLAVAVLVALFLAQPFKGRASRRRNATGQDVSALLAERERMIGALQELDFDHALGKVPAEDYPAQRAELVQKGADILRKLDATSALTPNPSPRGRGGAAAADDDLEALIAARRSARKNKSGGFCPRCGKPVLASDRFCQNCGKALG